MAHLSPVFARLADRGRDLETFHVLCAPVLLQVGPARPLRNDDSRRRRVRHQRL